MHFFRNPAALSVCLFSVAGLAGCTAVPGTQVVQTDSVQLASAPSGATGSLGEQQPADAGSKNNMLRLAQDIEARGSVATALPLYQRASEADPNNANTHVALGDAYLKLEREDNAAKSYRRALLIDPEHPQAMYGMGSILIRSHSTQEGLDMLTKAAPRLNSPQAYDRLGVAYIMLEQPDQALACFEQAYQLDRKNVDVMTNLALAAALMGQKGRTIELSKEAFGHPDFKAYHSRNFVLALWIVGASRDVSQEATKMLTADEMASLLARAETIRKIANPRGRAKALGTVRVAAKS
jgi:tetratricopeptide (TPR) repeat protein